MNVKRFIGDDVTEAMNKVRSELGRDAFILNTRKLKRKGFFGFLKKPLIEIVAAYENPSLPQQSVLQEGFEGTIPALPIRAFAQSAPPAWVPPPAPEQDVLNMSLANQRSPLATLTTAINTADVFKPIFPVVEKAPAEPKPEEGDRIRELENKLDSLSNTLGNLVSKMQIKDGYRTQYPPEIESFVLSLIENEVHEEFAHKIAREVSDIVAKQQESVNEVCEQILKQHMGESQPIKLKRFKRQVVLLTGPTGVGKTTTLAKLAAIYSINHHAKVGIISADTYRIAAVEQLKTYAEILEVPISVAYSPEEVGEYLKEHEDKDVVFVDTSGRSPNDKELEKDISQLIKHSQADEVHLVISATTSFSGCVNILNKYSFLKDFKILVTKLDETPTWGTVLNLKFLADKPLSYTAMGQNVPDDIEVADSRKIITKLIGRVEA
jgi:flagellar biosynthesis protein FlhF